MPIYCKYEGVDGDVTETQHKKWIELNSFQWGVGRSISAPVGAMADRESSAPSVSEIVVTKDTDAATSKLLNEALQGKGKGCTLHFCKTDQNQMQVYQEYTLENTMISGYSVSSGGDKPSESISLNFSKIMCKDVALGAVGDDGQPATVGYDLGQAQVL